MNPSRSPFAGLWTVRGPWIVPVRRNWLADILRAFPRLRRR